MIHDREAPGMGPPAMPEPEKLDHFIARHCSCYVEVLRKLASAEASESVAHSQSSLAEHLRALARARPSAFDAHFLDEVDKYSKPGSNPIYPESFDARAEGASSDFQIDKYYFSRHGIFKVTSTKPFPQIEPRLYPPCHTSYFAAFMLAEHNRIIDEHNRSLAEHRKLLESINSFAASFVLPNTPVQVEIDELIAQHRVVVEKYHLMVEANHRAFLRGKGKPYPGTRTTTQERRLTSCFSCKEHLSNVLYAECCGCGWIVCSCGACGCGYSGPYRARPDSDSTQ